MFLNKNIYDRDQKLNNTKTIISTIKNLQNNLKENQQKPKMNDNMKAFYTNQLNESPENLILTSPLVKLLMNLVHPHSDHQHQV